MSGQGPAKRGGLRWRSGAKPTDRPHLSFSSSPPSISVSPRRKSRQSYTLGKTPIYSSGNDHADRKALRRAIKEGRAAEELLDRRSKMKSDKFA